MPRTTKLTPELLDQIVALVRDGNPEADALQIVGIHQKTGWRWRQRATERPGSIYGTYRDRIATATAEASAIKVRTLTVAHTQGTTTTTTVTKSQRDRQGQLVVVEETVTTRIDPPDPKWAAWMLERMNPRWRSTQQIDAQVQTIPPDMLDRSMGELLRLARGDEGPSLLLDDDDEARALIPSSMR